MNMFLLFAGRMGGMMAEGGRENSRQYRVWAPFMERCREKFVNLRGNYDYEQDTICYRP